MCHSYVACELLRQANYRDNCTFRSLAHVIGDSKDTRRKRVINLTRPKPLPANESIEYTIVDRFRCRSRMASERYPVLKKELEKHWLVDPAAVGGAKPWEVPEVGCVLYVRVCVHVYVSASVPSASVYMRQSSQLARQTPGPAPSPHKPTRVPPQTCCTCPQVGVLEVDFHYMPWPPTDMELLNATGFDTLIEILLRFHHERSDLLKLMAQEHHFLCVQVCVFASSAYVFITPGGWPARGSYILRFLTCTLHTVETDKRTST